MKLTLGATLLVSVLFLSCGKKSQSGAELHAQNKDFPIASPNQPKEADPEQLECQEKYRFPNKTGSLDDPNDVQDIFHDPLIFDDHNKSAIVDEGEHYTRKIVNAQQAWSISQGSRDVLVAVVDSGVEVTHPDLKNNLWTNAQGEHGWDFILNRPAEVDGSGHGTHCAGNVGAIKNGFGVVGVSPHVKIMSVRFLDSSGGGSTANAVRALYYAVDQGAQVISNSWGGSGTAKPCLQKAIEYAHSKGVYVVASAGNKGKNTDLKPSYPGSYPGVIAVGNSTSSDKKNSGSNYGKNKVFIFAPGTNSLSTTTASRGLYREATGTSMSAPQVAGAIALALAVKPNISREVLLRELCESSAPVLTTYSQCGRLDLGEFIKRVSQL